MTLRAQPKTLEKLTVIFWNKYHEYMQIYFVVYPEKKISKII